MTHEIIITLEFAVNETSQYRKITRLTIQYLRQEEPEQTLSDRSERQSGTEDEAILVDQPESTSNQYLKFKHPH